MEGTWKSAIVVGASSGIGAAVARRLAAAGTRVALVARRDDAMRQIADAGPADRFTVHVHDVCDGAAVPALYESIESAQGPVDLVVYAAGLLIPVEAAEYSFAKDRDMLLVNLVGAVAWLDQAAARMEAARHGTIVGISSIAGDRGRCGAPVYGASKAGLTTYLEALRNRLTRHGVTVMTARPGYVDTAMTKGMPNLFWLISPDRAAEIILAHASKGPRDRHVPARWGLVSAVIRCIPSFVFRKLTV